MRILIERLGEKAEIKDLDIKSESNTLKKELKQVVDEMIYVENSGLSTMQLIANRLYEIGLYSIVLEGFENKDNLIH